MQLDLNQLRDLLASLNQTDISELTLKGENFELVVRRGSSSAESGVQERLVAAPVGLAPAPLAVAPLTQAAAPMAAPPVPPPSATPNWVELKSPMVGTFYRAPGPGEPEFVAVGDRIRLGQTVCILEAMKLMNELEAEISGEVLEVLAQNGQAVEFDQPLMRIIPD